MYQIIIEHCFFATGRHYDAIIMTCDTEEKAKLEREIFLINNVTYKNHSIIIRKKMNVYLVFDYNGNELTLLGIFKNKIDADNMQKASPDSWIAEHEVIG